MKTRYDVLYDKFLEYKKNNTYGQTINSFIGEFYDFGNDQISTNIPQSIHINRHNTIIELKYDFITIKCTKIDDKTSEEEIIIHTTWGNNGINSLIIHKKYAYKKCIASEITAGDEKLNYEGVDDLVNAETYENIVSEYKSVEKHTLTLEYGRLKKGK